MRNIQNECQVPTNCTFPQKWEGSWFLSGYQQSIHIKGSLFSYRGKCTAADGNKYLIVDERGCHRCLVIYEKHTNVLQYKESECDGDSLYMDQSSINNPAAMPIRSIINSDRVGGAAHPNSRFSSLDPCMGSYDDPSYCKGREILQNLCDQIPGDALLYSLFREQAEPVKCPLKGPYTFTYNRGHGECRNPVSNIDSCTEESRLLLSFQACPDVQGTESTVEELTCLATWKDGNSRYLVGLVSHHHAISNEDRFRCFVYEKILTMVGAFSSQLNNPNLKDAEYKLAQSGDATCNGLDSAEVGSRIMTLRKPPPAERCDFPVWLKGPRHWYSLKGNFAYQFHSSDGSMHITRPNGYTDTRAFCEQINKQTSNEMTAVVHFTSGCKKGFMCMSFYRRDIHIAEIQMGQPASRLEDACLPDHFDVTKMLYVTLLASNSESSKCPTDGLYHLLGAIGPPNVVSRHKRNHNNNNNHYSNDVYNKNYGHNGKEHQQQQHGHHHHYNHHQNQQHHHQHQHYYYHNNQKLKGHKRHDINNEQVNDSANIITDNISEIGNHLKEESTITESKHTFNTAIRNRRYIIRNNSTHISNNNLPLHNSTPNIDDIGGSNNNSNIKDNIDNVKSSLPNNNFNDDKTLYNEKTTTNNNELQRLKENSYSSNYDTNINDSPTSIHGFIKIRNQMTLNSVSLPNGNFIKSNSNTSHGFNNDIVFFTELSTSNNLMKTEDSIDMQKGEQYENHDIRSQYHHQHSPSQHHHHNHHHHHHKQHNNHHHNRELKHQKNYNQYKQNHHHHHHHPHIEKSSDVEEHLYTHYGDSNYQQSVNERKSIEIYNEKQEKKQKPQRNRRDAPGCTVNYKTQRQLRIGCTDLNQIDVRPQCNDESEVYICYGSWTENMNIYIIARNLATQHLVCLTYIPFIGNEAKLVIGDECYHHSHEKQSDHLIATNITKFGQCGDSSTADKFKIQPIMNYFLPIILIISIHLLHNIR
ncbi:uncharacterized protein LOC129607572 [Condylostylus longicornis]|uniref:uncharacterized protein LOC129607572 n=1 Tax=Condylostylus longicornis TaxID=2530218 RepID=UPI00244DDD5B|nr:uncharacterized protein LOC129607572 [Condylostylus longicornis]